VIPLRYCEQVLSDIKGENSLWKNDKLGLVGLVIPLRPQTPKHIRGGWSHYADTSKPVDGNGAQN
jgi:hypothetical protein